MSILINQRTNLITNLITLYQVTILYNKILYNNTNRLLCTSLDESLDENLDDESFDENLGENLDVSIFLSLAAQQRDLSVV